MTGTSQPTLDISALSYTAGGRLLLDRADLSLSAGESAAVTGPSGSGKSTLLMCVLGLIRPQEGSIAIAGTDIARLRPRQLSRHRRENTGMVFQFGELLPELTPVENVALPALLSGIKRDAAFDRAQELLDELGVPATGTPTGDLSGGERQRAAVARALVNQPTLLLADEPTGSLDERNRENVADLIFSLPSRWGCAVLVVTHDPAIAARADRHYALREGRLAPQAPGVPAGSAR